MALRDSKREYQRLKRNIQNRLKNISGTEFEHTRAYQYGVAMFTGINASIRGKNKSQIESMINNAMRFLNDNTSLTALRRKRDNTIKQMNERFGEDILNKDNYFQFIDFLNNKSIEDISRWLDSDQAIDLFKMKDKGLSMKTIVKNWSDLLDHTEEINDYLDKVRERGKRVNSRKIREILND